MGRSRGGWRFRAKDAEDAKDFNQERIAEHVDARSGYHRKYEIVCVPCALVRESRQFKRGEERDSFRAKDAEDAKGER